MFIIITTMNEILLILGIICIALGIYCIYKVIKKQREERLLCR